MANDTWALAELESSARSSRSWIAACWTARARLPLASSAHEALRDPRVVRVVRRPLLPPFRGALEVRATLGRRGECLKRPCIRGGEARALTLRPGLELQRLIEEPGRGRVLYFSSFRSGGAFPDAGPVSGDADIYSSEWRGGSFGPPELVQGVNTAADDGQPNLRRDALEIYFYSTRQGVPGTTGTCGLADIFVATRASAHDPWSAPVNAGPNVNSALGAETRPFLSSDGSTLYYGSTAPASVRPSAEGASDIYMTTRSR